MLLTFSKVICEQSKFKKINILVSVVEKGKIKMNKVIVDKVKGYFGLSRVCD